MAETEQIYSVALFGAVGTGKSSIINLLAGRTVADVSTSVEPCTRRARWYPISVQGKKFRFWDTMGFNVAEATDAKDIHPLSPYEQAYSLLQNVPGGVHVILLCARANAISASLRKLHWLLDSYFFAGLRVRIAVVLTHFDVIPAEARQSGWLSRNMGDIVKRSGIPLESIPHACITTVSNMSPETSDPLYQQSKDELEALLDGVCDASSPCPPTSLTEDAAVENLKTNCQLNDADAKALVAKFRSPTGRRRNVILFGESGSGKSSVINLLGGEPNAKVSSSLYGCTLDFKRHKVNTGLHQFEVWDTVGFNGTHMSYDIPWEAIKNAVSLIRSLHGQGGIDLIVFCKKLGRLQEPETNSFKLFYEVLCEKKVPVAVIITHLDSTNYKPMEDWWKKNEKDLLGGLKLQSGDVVGHACITAVAEEDSSDQAIGEKLAQSRQDVQAMLEDSISHCDAFTKEEGSWIIAFLRKLIGVVLRARNPHKKVRITAKDLVSRCKLRNEDAKELAKLLATE